MNNNFSIERSRFARRGIALIPWLLLVVALAITLVLWQQQEELKQASNRNRLAREVESVRSAIVARLTSYENLLQNAHGWIQVNGSVDRGDWQEYVQTLDVPTRYPGISGVGFMVEVPARLLPAFENSARAEGAEGFNVWPRSDNAVLFPVKYLEPAAMNAHALGLNIAVDDAQRDAAERARDSGAMVISPKIQADSPLAGQADFLMLVPVYRGGMAQASVEERRAALLGWVYAPFRASEFMKGILGPGAPQVDLQVADGLNPTAADVLYNADLAMQDRAAQEQLAETTTIEVGGRAWTLKFIPLSSFISNTFDNQPVFVLGGGISASLLLFALSTTLLNTRTTALALAAQMTKQLRESEERYRLITENAADLIAVVDRDGKRLYNSPSYEHILGYAPEALRGAWSFAQVHPDDRARVMAAADETVRKGFSAPIEYRMQHRDGGWLTLESVSSAIRNSEAQVENLVIVARDITARKRAEQLVQQRNAYIENILGLVTTLDLNQLLTTILERAGRLVGTGHGYVFLLEPSAPPSPSKGVGEAMVMRVGVGFYEKLIGTRAARGVGLAGQVWATGAPIVVDDYRVWQERLPNPDRDVLRAVVGVPLRSGEKVVGIIGLASLDDAQQFGPEALDALNQFASLASIALENARLYSDAQRAQAEAAAALQEKEVLLKEIHHRVKNNLQIISSLLNLQAAYVKDRASLEIFRDSQSRVRSMALIHEKLYQSQDLARVDFQSYVQNLVAYLFRSYGANPDRVQCGIDVRNVLLGIDAAIPCGLIISELVSNALKYAFPASRAGEIRVEMYRAGAHELALTVADNGVGLPEALDFKQTESLGLQLVDTLTNQLGGSLELRNHHGTRFTIRFPN